jgi:glyoxylase-like metal-dependent hydrolase (beta-lactamase superfamily II)/predicted DCC family thiol-disulfide oxidoreductase YuxK
MAGRIQVFYDSQCEVCQAFVSWLRLLDRGRQTDAVPLEPKTVRASGLDFQACSEQLHVMNPDGRVRSGWTAVAFLARRFPATWLIGALGAIPPFRWLGALLYGWVARNRYALSKCRGGACRSWKPEDRRRAPLAALWTCHWTGLAVRLPLSLGALAGQIGRNLLRYVRTRRRRIVLLDGRLQMLMLTGFPTGLISLLFGEQFLTILYGGIAIDPGPTRLRGSLARHLRRLPAGSIRDIVATHHHEEHAGNLNWLAARTGARIHVGEATARCLSESPPLPWIRRFMIGERPRLEPPFQLLGERLGGLEIIPVPGHCDDHVALYDRQAKILFAGDAFMGAYFSAPNPDVDHRQWIGTLRRLLDLDIEILVEGHGFLHTLRADIPGDCPLLVRRDPREQLLEKLRFCEWVADQVAAGLGEGLPAAAIEVTCFPWGRRFAWENFLNDELSRLFSGGHWSRTEMVRSFVRPAGSESVLPLVYEARLHRRRQEHGSGERP